MLGGRVVRVHVLFACKFLKSYLISFSHSGLVRAYLTLVGLDSVWTMKDLGFDLPVLALVSSGWLFPWSGVRGLIVITDGEWDESDMKIQQG